MAEETNEQTEAPRTRGRAFGGTFQPQHPEPSADVPAPDEAPPTEPVAAPSSAVGSQTYGTIGPMHHIVVDGRTTACGKQLDSTSTTQRLARMPLGVAVCGTCVGIVIG